MINKLKGFVSGVLVTIILMSTFAFADGIKQKIEVIFNSVNLTVNGEVVKADTVLYNGTTYVPLRPVAEMLGKEVGWDQNTNTASINDKIIEKKKDKENTQNEKTIVTKADLPYTIDAKNGMSLTINSYTASKSGIKFNFTIINNSLVSDKGKIMFSTYDIYDGKETLKYITMDNIFYDTSYLRSEQSITGNVAYQGLSHDTDTFTLYGKLWQYVDAEDFKITFKVE